MISDDHLPERFDELTNAYEVTARMLGEGRAAFRLRAERGEITEDEFSLLLENAQRTTH
jgi:hypothetical protein